MIILQATSTGKKINVPGSIKLPEVLCEIFLSLRLVSWSVVSILIHDYLDMTENMLSNLLDVNYVTNILLKHELYQVYQPIFGILIINYIFYCAYIIQEKEKAEEEYRRNRDDYWKFLESCSFIEVHCGGLFFF